MKSMRSQTSSTRRFPRRAKVFADRSEVICRSIGAEPSIMNWIETDMPNLLIYDFEDLNVTGPGLPGDEGMTNQERTDFESMWKEDEDISQATEATLQIDMELGRASTSLFAASRKRCCGSGRSTKRRVQRTNARPWHVRAGAPRIP